MLIVKCKAFYNVNVKVYFQDLKNISSARKNYVSFFLLALVLGSYRKGHRLRVEFTGRRVTVHHEVSRHLVGQYGEREEYGLRSGWRSG